MTKVGPLVDTKILRPAETVLALGIVGKIDLLRLKAIARLHARGLPPDVGWEDLLQEALTRVFAGARPIPDGVTAVAFLAGVMRSLKSDHWRRAGRASPGPCSKPDVPELDRKGKRSRGLDELPDTLANPERVLIARQQLEAIQDLFAGDSLVQGIIVALGVGKSAEQIRVDFKISKTEYDSARKRMRRALLREGLTCEPK